MCTHTIHITKSIIHSFTFLLTHCSILDDSTNWVKFFSHRKPFVLDIIGNFEVKVGGKREREKIITKSSWEVAEEKENKAVKRLFFTAHSSTSATYIFFCNDFGCSALDIEITYIARSCIRLASNKRSCTYMPLLPFSLDNKKKKLCDKLNVNITLHYYNGKCHSRQLCHIDNKR
jgi:hypothetical protein